MNPREVCTDDVEAWLANPAHRWIYNKLTIAEMQGLRCGPYGVPIPDGLRVIWRPIINLDGMGRGAFFDGEGQPGPGMFWCEVLEGAHESLDLWIDGCAVTWVSFAVGFSRGCTQFSQWELFSEQDLDSETSAFYLDAVNPLVKALPCYCGPLNVEMIDWRIIEAHLRWSPDWVNSGCYDEWPKVKGATATPIFRDDPDFLLDDPDSPRLGIKVVKEL